MEFELVITNGTVVDGTGAPRFRADLGISGGKIKAVSRGGGLPAGPRLDATGLVIAPGFIDSHSHADWILPLAEHDSILAPLVQQGITTVVTGQCGFSPAPVTAESIPLLDDFSEMMRERSFAYPWQSMAGYLDTLEQRGVLLNAAFLAGHGTLRYAVMGDRTGPPSQDELDTLCDLTRHTLDEGAFGLSAGLAYAPGIFSRNEELLPLLRTVASQGALFTVHGRAYTWVSSFYTPMIIGTAHNIRSVRELLDLAQQADVRLQLSHQIFVGRRTWRTHRRVLKDIDRAADQGLDVAFDAFPYTAGNTTINVIFPEWFLDGFLDQINDPDALRKVKREIDLLRLTLGIDWSDITLLWGQSPDLEHLEGLDFGAIGQTLGLPSFEAYAHVARLSTGSARVLLDTYSGCGEREEPLRAVLSHPRCAFMTDTILTSQGKHNPASFGTFPRVLARYSRDMGLFSLEEAIRRMTSFPAQRIGLSGLGRIEEGLWADLVIFDPRTIADNTSQLCPDAPPTGIEAVLISGQTVVQQGQMVGEQRQGRILRRQT